MTTLTRRDLLGAGIAVLGFRTDPIRFTLAPDAGAALTAGVRFGLAEAARATMLLGRRLELTPETQVVVRADAAIDAAGTVFSIRPEPATYDEAMRSAGTAAGPLPAAARAVEWHHSLSRYGASELNQRFTRDTGLRMAAEHWLGWMAVKIIAEASLRATGGETLAAALARARFDGHKGVALRFTHGSRHLRQPLYVVDPGRDMVIWQD